MINPAWGVQAWAWRVGRYGCRRLSSLLWILNHLIMIFSQLGLSTRRCFAVLSGVLLCCWPLWGYALSDAQLASLRSQIAQGHWQAAAQTLSDWLRSEHDAQGWLLLAQVRIRLGQVDGAWLALQRAEELNQLDSWRMLQAQILLAQHDYAAILALGIQAQDSADLKAYLLALQGDALRSQQQPEAAARLYARALALEPEQLQALIGLARLAIEADHLSLAANRVEQLLTRYNREPEVLSLSGELLLLQQAPERALQRFDEAVRLQPEYQAARLGRAESLLALGRYLSALQQLDALLNQNPRWLEARYLRARAFLQLGQFTQARSDLDSLLNQQLEYAPAWLLGSALDLSEGRLDAAATGLQRFLNLRPQHNAARKLLAVIEMKRRRPRQAIEVLSPLLGQTAQDPQVLALLGSAWLQNGDYQQGSRWMRQAAQQVASRSLLDVANFHLSSDPNAPLLNGGLELVQLSVLQVMAKLDAGQVDAAIGDAQTLAQQQPNDPLSHNLLGAAYLARGDDHSARAAFEQALRLQPDLPPVVVNLARLDLKAGDGLAAEQRYHQLLERDPRSLDALLGLADVAMQQNHPEQASEWLEQAWSLYPDAVDVGLALVKRYLEINRAGAALESAERLRQVQPGNPAVIRAYGLALLANGDAITAARQFRRLLNQDPTSVEVWHLLATAQQRLRDSVGALASLDKALSLQPDYLPSMIMRFQLQQQQRDEEAALNSARLIQQKHPESAVGFQLEGEWQQQRGGWGLAIDNFERAYHIAPSAYLAQALANAQKQSGIQEGALMSLRRWLNDHPDDWTVRNRLAQYLDQFKRIDEAVVEYEKLLEQRPDDLLVLNNLAWLYYLKGDPRSLQYAERALEKNPERAEVLDTLGWVLAQQGKPERGLALLQEALLRAPQFADIRYHVAAVYAQLGRKQEALVELDKLLQKKVVQFSYAEEAQQLRQKLLAQ